MNEKGDRRDLIYTSVIQFVLHPLVKLNATDQFKISPSPFRSPFRTLFQHPYTKVAFLERDLQVSRATATRYLDALADGGLLQKYKQELELEHRSPVSVYRST